MGYGKSRTCCVLGSSPDATHNVSPSRSWRAANCFSTLTGPPCSGSTEGIRISVFKGSQTRCHLNREGSKVSKGLCPLPLTLPIFSHKSAQPACSSRPKGTHAEHPRGTNRFTICHLRLTAPSAPATRHTRPIQPGLLRRCHIGRSSDRAINRGV